MPVDGGELASYCRRLSRSPLPSVDQESIRKKIRKCLEVACGSNSLDRLECRIDKCSLGKKFNSSKDRLIARVHTHCNRISRKLLGAVRCWWVWSTTGDLPHFLSLLY